MNIKNSQGKSLSAALHIPEGEGPFPAALVLHGYTGCKDEHHIKTFAHDLSRNGILALRFDTLGVHESEGTFEKDFRVSQYVSDVEDVYEFLKQNDLAQKDKIAVCGHSLGASLAIISAARNHAYAACCAVQPPTKITRPGNDHELEYWDSVGVIEESLGAPMTGTVKLPAAFGHDADKWDTADFSPRVTCPLMIMYGTADQGVLPEVTLSIYEAAPENTELVKLEGVDHDFQSNKAHLQLVTHHLVSFMRRKLIR